MEEIKKSVRKYMAAIGRKGGAAGKGTEWRREVCRHAAIVRWRDYREKKRLEAEKTETEKESVDSEAAVQNITA
jgi:hypothetical protein